MAHPRPREDWIVWCLVRKEKHELPDVSGRYQILERELRFIPHFPFESGIRYHASFDPRPLGHVDLKEVLKLEFSFPHPTSTEAAHVEQAFPSDDLLPENLLRFYIHFSNSMQRGRTEQHIRILGPDGQPAPDVLYRPPVELWDRRMQRLTILLDPGRLKRGVGPNRELGPPLKAGLDYTLVVGSGMLDASGRSMAESFYKTFRVAEPVREPIEVNQWVVVAPRGDTRQPLVLVFPRPLDWALLLHTITVASEGGGQYQVVSPSTNAKNDGASHLPHLGSQDYIRYKLNILLKMCAETPWLDVSIGLFRKAPIPRKD